MLHKIQVMKWFFPNSSCLEYLEETEININSKTKGMKKNERIFDCSPFGFQEIPLKGDDIKLLGEKAQFSAPNWKKYKKERPIEELRKTQ